MLQTATPTLRERYVAWWLDDYPPLSGQLRLLFYGGLLAVAIYHPKSPLRGIQLYAQTDPVMYRSYGLIAFLGIPVLPWQAVAGVVAVTAIAWVAAAIGLFSRASSIVTAIGAFAVHGYFWGSNVFNHNWYLAIYVLAALCFAAPDPVWSADAWLARRRGRPIVEARGIGATGFARKLALVCTVTFYFAAGCTKLQTSGLAWGDGHTVSYWASIGAFPLAPYLAANPFLSQGLSIFTLFLEAGAPLALVSRRMLWVFVPGWIGLHLGIRLTMGPRYWENIVCFLLIVRWHDMARLAAPREIAIAASRTQRGSLTWAERATVSIGTIAIVAAVAVAAFQINWWPFTNVYMYSSYYSVPRDIRAGEPREAYFDPAAVQGIARRFRDASRSFDELEHLPRHAVLRLTGDGIEPLRFFDAGPGVPSAKHWDLVIELPVLIDDLASKPAGRIAFDPAASPTNASRFLAELVPLVHRDTPGWEKYRSLELTYWLRDNEVVLASVPLHAAQQRP